MTAEEWRKLGFPELRGNDTSKIEVHLDESLLANAEQPKEKKKKDKKKDKKEEEPVPPEVIVAIICISEI